MQQGFTRKPRILIVGAGATGAVIGHHLAQADADVTFLVKPKYKAHVAEGIPMHRYGLFSKQGYTTFTPLEVYGALEECAGNIFTQVWLCVSSDALREGDWLQRLKPYTGNAPIVCMQPGMQDREVVEAVFGPQRVASGMVGFVAYQCPLPGETIFPEGVAYFLPPLSPCFFFGPEGATLPAVELIHRGGITAAYRKDARAVSALNSALLMPTIVGLETAGWSLETFRNSPALELSLRAADELMTLAERIHGTDRGFAKRTLLKPWLFKMLLGLAKSLASFPLEPYLQYHFTKVRAQTYQMMGDYGEAFQKLGIPAPAMAELYGTWAQMIPAPQPTTALAGDPSAMPTAPGTLPHDPTELPTDPGSHHADPTQPVSAPGLEEDTEPPV